ncbi:MAG: hypothetical protein Kow0029_06390 [Candidatus Rifleibacteriota bacterium]
MKECFKLSIFCLLVFLISSANAAIPDSVMQKALEMYKLDFYLPAIDLLENAAKSESDKTFNYLIYLGLAYQKTDQLDKALETYQKALNLNPSARNLENRISALKIKMADPDFSSAKLESPKEKARWLVAAAIKEKNAGELAKAFILLFQAIEYDEQVLYEQEQLVIQAEIYFNLQSRKDNELDKLFHSFYLILLKKSDCPQDTLKVFANTADKPAFLKELAVKYLEKLNQLKLKEKVLAEKKARESAKATQAVKSDNKPLKIVTSKPSRPKASNVEKEKPINTSFRATPEDVARAEAAGREYSLKQAEALIDQLNNAATDKEKYQLIWQLGNLNAHSPEITAKFAEFLNSDDIPLISTTLDAIVKLGPPTSDNLIDYLSGLLDRENKTIEYLAIDALGKLRNHPSKVIPKLVKLYTKYDDIYQKRHAWYSIAQYGKGGLPVLYQILENTPTSDRAPIAEIINKISGESIQSLINR